MLSIVENLAGVEKSVADSSVLKDFVFLKLSLCCERGKIGVCPVKAVKKMYLVNMLDTQKCSKMPF